MVPAVLERPCKACKHDDIRLRYRYLSNHSLQYVGQCQRCGTATNAIRKQDALAAANGHEIPEFSEALREAAKQANKVASDERYEALFAQLAEQPGFWERYDEHLASERWQQIRGKVLRRAGGMCEGCLDNPATQVHHLSYKHLGHEFLWELVAICDTCHERCHNEGQYDFLKRPR